MIWSPTAKPSLRVKVLSCPNEGSTPTKTIFTCDARSSWTLSPKFSSTTSFTKTGRDFANRSFPSEHTSAIDLRMVSRWCRRVACRVTEQVQERELRATIAFAEWVDCIELGEKHRSGRHKVFCGGRPEVRTSFETAKEFRHRRSDVLWKAERVAPLRGPHRAVLAGPSIDILEQESVDRSIVSRAEITDRERLIGTQRRHLELERLQRFEIADAQKILECSGVLVGVGGRRRRHSLRRPSARLVAGIGADDLGALLVGR